MKLRVHPFYVLFICAFFPAVLWPCQTKKQFPGEQWQVVGCPEELGYSSTKLEKAKEYADSLNTAAVVIVVNGQVLYQWGDVEKKFNSHSMRKSVLSALYGKYVSNGAIDIDVTIEELGIDDEPPLTDEEKKATIRDCLKARSGIYHSALYETPNMRALKPERHSMKPGIHWYYNNWDFNVLGTIFEKLTGKKIFRAIKEDIADHIQMENYKPEDGLYVSGEESIHPAYPFRITARDLARFGLLMLNKGNWNGKQIIRKDWVEESTAYYSDATLYAQDGYGYMWWVTKHNNKFPHFRGVELPEGSYSAKGAGGHYVLVIPVHDMVIVHRVNTDIKDNKIPWDKLGKMIHLVLEAKEE